MKVPHAKVAKDVKGEIPRRIQLSRKKGWKMPANTVVVARGPGRKWGNVFVVHPILKTDDPHTLLMDAQAGVCFSREAAKVRYSQWLMVRPQYVADAKKELRGKNLACWCPPGEPCHADVLLEVANQ